MPPSRRSVLFPDAFNDCHRADTTFHIQLLHTTGIVQGEQSNQFLKDVLPNPITTRRCPDTLQRIVGFELRASLYVGEQSKQCLNRPQSSLSVKEGVCKGCCSVSCHLPRPIGSSYPAIFRTRPIKSQHPYTRHYAIPVTTSGILGLNIVKCSRRNTLRILVMFTAPLGRKHSRSRFFG